MSATEQKETTRTYRWSIGLFRNPHGKLVTIYTRKDGTPVPSAQDRVGDAEILHHGTYADMTYAEARQRLLSEAEEQGITDEKRDPSKLDEDFPGFKQLTAAGIETLDELKAIEDLTEIDGIGPKTAEAIREAM